MPEIKGNSAFTEKADQDIRSTEQIFFDEVAEKDKTANEKPKNLLRQTYDTYYCPIIVSKMDSAYNHTLDPLSYALNNFNPNLPNDVYFYSSRSTILSDRRARLDTVSIDISIENRGGKAYSPSPQAPGLTDHVITTYFALYYYTKDLSFKVCLLYKKANTYTYTASNNTYTVDLAFSSYNVNSEQSSIDPKEIIYISPKILIDYYKTEGVFIAFEHAEQSGQTIANMANLKNVLMDTSAEIFIIRNSIVQTT